MTDNQIPQPHNHPSEAAPIAEITYIALDQLLAPLALRRQQDGKFADTLRQLRDKAIESSASSILAEHGITDPSQLERAKAIDASLASLQPPTAKTPGHKERHSVANTLVGFTAAFSLAACMSPAEREAFDNQPVASPSAENPRDIELREQYDLFTYQTLQVVGNINCAVTKAPEQDGVLKIRGKAYSIEAAQHTPEIKRGLYRYTITGGGHRVVIVGGTTNPKGPRFTDLVLPQGTYWYIDSIQFDRTHLRSTDKGIVDAAGQKISTAQLHSFISRVTNEVTAAIADADQLCGS